jgi:DNA-binding transcriptional LysR family regulator
MNPGTNTNRTKGISANAMSVRFITPRLLSDDMTALKQAAIAGLGVVALPGYVCREDVRSGALRRVLPTWLADDSTITARIAYRQGLLPSVRVFIDHLAAEFPKAVMI